MVVPMRPGLEPRARFVFFLFILSSLIVFGMAAVAKVSGNEPEDTRRHPSVERALSVLPEISSARVSSQGDSIGVYLELPFGPLEEAQYRAIYRWLDSALPGSGGTISMGDGRGNFKSELPRSLGMVSDRVLAERLECIVSEFVGITVSDVRVFTRWRPDRQKGEVVIRSREVVFVTEPMGPYEKELLVTLATSVAGLDFSMRPDRVRLEREVY